LLVDDADAELDAARLERLFASFDSLSRLIVTSNRAELWRFAARLQPVDVRELSRRSETAAGRSA
jgi:recombinational DNA repair ATPase RecF